MKKAFSNRSMRTVLATLGAGIGLSMASPAAAQAGCSDELLNEIETTWLAAIETGSMFTMNLGEWIDYSENGRRASLGGFLDKPRKVDWHLTIKDKQACRIFVEHVVLDEARPMVFGTTIGNGVFGVGPFKNVVTDEGDWLFNAQKTYEYASREKWNVIPEARRNTRAELQAAADAYLDLFSDKNAVVPWGTPCARLEGSAYTGKGTPEDSCNVGVPENVKLTNREYTIDESLGAVAVMLKFGEKERPDTHLFRVEDGKIRYIHTITACGTENNCGFKPFAEMLKENPGMHPPVAN